MKRPGERKLLNSFGVYLAILIGFFLLSFLSMYVGIKMLDRDQKLFMERLMAEEKVDEALNELEECFQVYRNSWQEEDLKTYQYACQHLKDKLVDYNLYVTDSQDTQNYIRRLTGFCNYQMNLLSHHSSMTQRELYNL